MPTRKEQIEAFKKAHMVYGSKTASDAVDSMMQCTREEFLAYAFIRGRYFPQAERLHRPRSEKSGPNFFNVMETILKWFPVPDPTPVPVGPDGVEEPPPTPRGYPWPEVDYANLLLQLREWIACPAPDHDEYLEKVRLLRRKQIKDRVVEAAKYTDEYIEELRAKK